MICFTHIMLNHSHYVKLQYDKNHALFKLRVPIDYAQVHMCHHSGGIWHDRRQHWTSTLLTVINEIMIYSTSSSTIHTGMVCATGFPAIRTRTLGPHHPAIDMQRVGSMTERCPIDINCRGWQWGRRWQVRRRARRLEVGRRRLAGQGFLGQRRCTGVERLTFRALKSVSGPHDGLLEHTNDQEI